MAISTKRGHSAADKISGFGPVAERYRRSGDLERAVTLCRQGLEKFPDHLSGRVTLGWALLDLGRYDEARAELEQVLKRAPDNLAAIRGLAELHDRAESTMYLDMAAPGPWPPESSETGDDAAAGEVDEAAEAAATIEASNDTALAAPGASTTSADAASGGASAATPAPIPVAFSSEPDAAAPELVSAAEAAMGDAAAPAASTPDVTISDADRAAFDFGRSAASEAGPASPARVEDVVIETAAAAISGAATPTSADDAGGNADADEMARAMADALVSPAAAISGVEAETAAASPTVGDESVATYDAAESVLDEAAEAEADQLINALTGAVPAAETATATPDDTRTADVAEPEAEKTGTHGDDAAVLDIEGDVGLDLSAAMPVLGASDADDAIGLAFATGAVAEPAGDAMLDAAEAEAELAAAQAALDAAAAEAVQDELARAHEAAMDEAADADQTAPAASAEVVADDAAERAADKAAERDVRRAAEAAEAFAAAQEDVQGLAAEVEAFASSIEADTTTAPVLTRLSDVVNVASDVQTADLVPAGTEDALAEAEARAREMVQAAAPADERDEDDPIDLPLNHLAAMTAPPEGEAPPAMAYDTSPADDAFEADASFDDSAIEVVLARETVDVEAFEQRQVETPADLALREEITSAFAEARALEPDADTVAALRAAAEPPPVPDSSGAEAASDFIAEAMQATDAREWEPPIAERAAPAAETVEVAGTAAAGTEADTMAAAAADAAPAMEAALRDAMAAAAEVESAQVAGVEVDAAIDAEAAAAAVEAEEAAAARPAALEAGMPGDAGAPAAEWAEAVSQAASPDPADVASVEPALVLEPIETPSSEPVQAARAEPVEAARAEPVEAARAEPVEAARAEPVEATEVPVLELQELELVPLFETPEPSAPPAASPSQEFGGYDDLSAASQAEDDDDAVAEYDEDRSAHDGRKHTSRRKAKKMAKARTPRQGRRRKADPAAPIAALERMLRGVQTRRSQAASEHVA
ncbi:MAG: tetratricopeptide repeat protein [Vicinamibacterales bacterium]